MLHSGVLTQPDFHLWRARTASILCSGYNFDYKRIQGISSKLEKDLRPYESRVYFDGLKQCPTLANVVQLAVEIDADFAQSRAWYQVYLRHPGETKESRSRLKGGLKFNGLTMSAVSKSKSQHRGAPQPETVSLVITPTVTKRGDSDGEGYENGSVLVKADVIVET